MLISTTRCVRHWASPIGGLIRPPLPAALVRRGVERVPAAVITPSELTYPDICSARGALGTPWNWDHQAGPANAYEANSETVRIGAYGCCRLSTVNAKTHGKHLIALACTAFCRKDSPVVRPFLFRGNGGFGVPEAAQQRRPLFFWMRRGGLRPTFAKLPVLMDQNKNRAPSTSLGAF